MEVTFDINKEEVYTEVAQTSSYTGAKMEGEDEEAYDRIFTTDEDRSQLERFWAESCSAVCETMKRYLSSETTTTGGHRFVLELSRSADPALVPSMKQEMFSFFVMNITSKWFVFTNKKEAADYGAAATALLESVHRKACYKRKPLRPTYN